MVEYMLKATPEDVEDVLYRLAKPIDQDDLDDAHKQVDHWLHAYAALLERQAQWPSDEDVERALLAPYLDLRVCDFRWESDNSHHLMRAALQAVAPVQASSCTEERPCTPCFIGKGVCEDANAHWQEQPPVQASAVPDGWHKALREVTDCLASAITGGKVKAYMAAEAIKNAEALLASSQPKVQP